MIPVIWHHNAGFWDCALPKWILNHAAKCTHFEGLVWAHTIPQKEIGVIVIPGRHSYNDYAALNQVARGFDKAIFVIIGDEEGIFHSGHLEHPEMKIWWFMPPLHPVQKTSRVAPNGYPTDAPEMIEAARKRTFGMRDIDCSFQGQMTHSRRVECVNATQRITGKYKCSLMTTEGFTQGVPRESYYETMVRSKLVLCPSGPYTPDSFRFAEALEAGCIPIVDNRTQYPDYPGGYWNYLFGDEKNFPFPVIDVWSDLPQVVELYLMDWKSRAKACKTWWEVQKGKLVMQMKEDLS